MPDLAVVRDDLVARIVLRLRGLALDLGIRTDPEAHALARAQELYDKAGRPKSAAEIFDRYPSLEAKVGAAMADWPDGTVTELQTLSAEYPSSALVALNLGLALYWSRRDAEAVQAWRSAAALEPDSFYTVRAGDLLHPRFAPGLPTFVPSFRVNMRAGKRNRSTLRLASVVAPS